MIATGLSCQIGTAPMGLDLAMSTEFVSTAGWDVMKGANDAHRSRRALGFSLRGSRTSLAL